MISVIQAIFRVFYRNIFRPATFPIVTIVIVLTIYNPSIRLILLAMGAIIIELLLQTLNLEIAAQKGLMDLKNYLVRFPQLRFKEYELSKTLPPRLKNQLLTEYKDKELPRFFQIIRPQKGVKRPTTISSFTIPSQNRVLQSSLIFDYCQPTELDPIRKFKLFHEVSHSSHNSLFTSREYRKNDDDLFFISLFTLLIVEWSLMPIIISVIWISVYYNLLTKTEDFRKKYCWLECETDRMALSSLSIGDIRCLNDKIDVFNLLRDNKMTEVENEVRISKLQRSIRDVFQHRQLPSRKQPNDMILNIVIIIWLLGFGFLIETQVSLWFCGILLAVAMISYWWLDRLFWRFTQRLEFDTFQELSTRLDDDPLDTLLMP